MYEKIFPFIEMSLLALKAEIHILAADDVQLSQKLYVESLEKRIDDIDEYIKEALVNN